jgi:hypothetical protein
MRSRDMEHTPEDSEMKRGGHMVRRGRHARGGKTGHEIHEYNALGSPEADEADKEEDGFKRGGKKKRAAGGIALKLRDGGHAEGHEPHHRPDRAARGGRTALKRGGEAHEEREEREHEKKERDHEKERRGGRAGEEEREHHARGGRAMDKGHTPFSSGHRGMDRDDSNSPEARGVEGIKVGDAPD